MNRIFLLFLSCTFSPFIFAQTPAEITEAMELVKRNKTTLNLTEEEISNIRISSTYFNDIAGTKMVYLQQTHLSMDVYNQMQVIAFKNNVVASNMGGVIKQIGTLLNSNTGLPLFSAADAVSKSLEDRNMNTTQSIIPISSSNNNRYVEFSDLGIARENITANLLWVPTENGMVELCWQVKLVPKNSSDYWNIRVNAINNMVNSKNNFTVSCNWSETANTSVCTNHAQHQIGHQKQVQTITPDIINGASYTVIPYPAESPQHTGGAPAVRTNPWLLAPVASNATSLKWHSNGTTDYTITRGNNVWAYEDRNADNIAGAADTSTTADPLTFNKVYDFTLEPIVTINQRAATTNLFYWNNIIHDLSYLYGFTEVAGNFQVNNQGRGGAGNDAVNAEAQDGAGSNNANFNTPADGSPGRMQMFLWTAPTPDKDGDLDNGIIVHEYGHGISNRFTGGPAAASCLNNQEQMGEGWSDYLGLMYTTNWATAVMADSIVARGIGTYALNQPTTGVGIRQYPYTHNMTVNPHTYANITTVAVPHGVGSVWCAMLWDLTWDLIGTNGINTNLYNTSSTGGNTVALKLVMEGMRLQPCSPGFVDGRNAILRADTILYGGVHSCTIWKAFARRGVGVNASQGLSSSRLDQTVDFNTNNFEFSLTQNVTEQSEGRDIIYTVTTKSVCATLTSYKIVDTLPLNVTYISGGTYNASNRTVTFTINLTPGNSVVHTFTVRVNSGAYTPPVTHFTEAVSATTIPASWTVTSTPSVLWRTSTTFSVSAPNAFFSADTTITSDQILTTTGSYNVTGTTTLSFQHRYVTENLWDGAVVEISTNNGTTWADLGNYFTANGYNATLNNTGTNPIRGRRAFSGNSVNFLLSVIDLSSFSGQSIRIRFRFGSDNSTGSTGWYVDDIQLRSEPAVFNSAKLFTAANVEMSVRSLSAKIVLSTLPVQLISFNGYVDHQNVQLQWLVENEKGIKNYDLERSTDGFQFLNIETITSNNALRSVYPFTDWNCMNTASTYYYRLKINEKNGLMVYSRIIKLSTQKASTYSISPNPAKDIIYINGLTANGFRELWITDILGKKLLTSKISFTSNFLNIAALEKGVYILQIRDKFNTEVYRFVKD